MPLRVLPKSVANVADEAIFLASSYGLTPDEWQADVLRAWLGLRRDGTWSASLAVLTVSRQNGKNAAIEMRELYGLVALGEKFLHTAHEVKTARKAFIRLCSFFENEKQYPELAALVKEIRRTNGQEAIVLHNGGSVEFVARSKGSARGFTVDVLVFDEAQDLSEEALAALLPTISAAPLGNPQRIITGTPPFGTMNGEVLLRTRANAIAGKNPRLCLIDYGVEGPLPDVDDRGEWAARNPAVASGRLSIDALADDRAIMDPEEFAREHLCWWGDPSASSTDALVSYRSWEALSDADAALERVQAFAVEVALDRASASIAAAGPYGDRVAVELVPSGRDETRDGIAWLVGRCRELDKSHGPAAWVVDAGGPAGGGLVEDLQAAGLRVVVGDVKTIRAATAGFVDAVNDGVVVHGPQPVLDAAVKSAVKRPLGDGGFAVSRTKSPVDVTPLIAVTLALWQARQGPSNAEFFAWDDL